MVAACAVSMLTESSLALSFIPQLEYPPVDYVVNVLRSFGQGLKLYDHVDGLTMCDLNTQNFASTLVDSASIFAISSGKPDVFREGIWLLTDALGLSSFAVRKCYDSYASMLELNEHYWEQLGSFYAASAELHDSVIASENELNTHGFAAVVSLYQGRYQDFVYSLTRGFYVAFLETHFTTYTPKL